MTLDGARIIAQVNFLKGYSTNVIHTRLVKTVVKHLLWLLRSFVKSEKMTLMMSL